MSHSLCAFAAAWMRGWITTHSGWLRWQDRGLGCGMIMIGLLVLLR